MSPWIPYLQALAHELPLREAQPPLARLIRSILIDARQQSDGQLLSNLHQVLLQLLCILATRWCLEHLVEWEAWVAWDGEVGVEGDVLDFFLCLPILVVSPVSQYLCTAEFVYAYLELIPDLTFPKHSLNHRIP